MKIYFDTEFTGLHKNTELISIGLVSEDGNEFYGEVSGLDTSRMDKWIKDNVLVNTVEYGGAQVLDICNDENRYFVGSKEDIASYLREYFMQFDVVELVSDVCHYDMVLFIDLFGTAFDIPDNISPCCYDINQDISKLYNLSMQDAFDYDREKFLEWKGVSIAAGDNGAKHNALYDARVIRAVAHLLDRE